MKAPDEYGINKDFTEKSTDWIATDSKRCTAVSPMYPSNKSHFRKSVILSEKRNTFHSARTFSIRLLK